MSGGTGWRVDPFSQTIPIGASPTDARQVIGPDVPAELVAFFAGFMGGYQVVSCFLWYFDGGADYYWEAHLNTHIGEAVERGHARGETRAGVVEIMELIDTGRIFTFIQVNGIPQNLQIGDPTATALGFGGVDTQFILTANVDFLVDAGSASVSQSGSMPRGHYGYIAGVANSGAIGAETVILTLPARTYRNGRTYNMVTAGNVTVAVANAANAQVIRVRVGGIAGTVERTIVVRCVAVGSLSFIADFDVSRVAGTDLSTAIVVTLQGVTNTAVADVAGNTPYFLRVMDTGRSSDFPNSNVLIP